MDRRNFLKAIPVAGVVGTIPATANWWSTLPVATTDPASAARNDRTYWTSLLQRIATPVLEHLAKGQLKQSMPTEKAPQYAKAVDKVTYLEAFGRTMAGIAPWLELGPDNTAEGKVRAQLIKYAWAATTQATDPASPDYMDWSGQHDAQPLVDAAFLAHAFIRAPQQLWQPLPAEVKTRVVNAFKALRQIKPGYNNWLLFAAMIEIALLSFGEAWDPMRVDFAVKKHQEWYKGDGMYGDGQDFHFDYYNGFVIQPMLVDILKVLAEKGKGARSVYEEAVRRMQRYGVIQERLISPEGTFPVVGRSMTYRNAAFQPLVQLALQEQLPQEITPGQVRTALTAVMKRIFETPGTFDKKDWLQLGFCGHQPEIADIYTSTGSLYLCTTGFLALGLQPAHNFWTSPAKPWTAQLAWSGKTIQKDHAL